jgi:hypothetical protein
MASWYSKLLTTTTSQISNLQNTYLRGENDGDTEDDSHVCRVLRGYYTEKGVPFPGWLPPDPKAPPPVAPVYAQPQVGARYGGLTQQAGGSGLSSLWDNNNQGGNDRQDPQSLRRGRGNPPPNRMNEQPARQSPFARVSDSGRDDVQARPLPSQRAGSYQQTNAYSRDADSAPPNNGPGGSAQDRLKQRLWGGARTASPSGQGPFNPPNQGQGGGYGNRGGSGGGGYGGGYGGGNDDYEDRFAPGGTYDNNRGAGGEKPFMAANAPWASNETEFMGGGGSGGGRAQGLPSGPKRTGLPTGPRMR